MAIDMIVDNGNVGIGESDQLSRLTVKAKMPFELAGTVAKTAASNTVTGTGTKFLKKVGIADRITIPGGGGDETRGVIAIASDTSLTVDLAFDNTASGQTATCLPSVARFASSDGTSHMTISDHGEVRIGPVEKQPTGTSSVGTVLQVHAATDVPFVVAITNETEAHGCGLWIEGPGLSISAIDNDDGVELLSLSPDAIRLVTG